MTNAKHAALTELVTEYREREVTCRRMVEYEAKKTREFLKDVNSKTIVYKIAEDDFMQNEKRLSTQAATWAAAADMLEQTLGRVEDA